MNMFREALALWRRTKNEKITSLQVRLLILFVLFICILLMSFFLILNITGVLNIGEKENKAWMNNEFSHLYGNINEDLSKLSLSGTELATQLSFDINRWMLENNLDGNQLKMNPDKLEALINNQIPTLYTSLKNNPCSGVFLILDATINPKITDHTQSKSGIFFKRTEPSAINTLNSKIYCLRGPADIARNMGVELMGQWQMEFTKDEIPFYDPVKNTAIENKGKPLSRLYYWTKRTYMEGNGESSILLCLPLMDAENEVYGVCGLEISAMLFKKDYIPSLNEFPRAFATLTPHRKENLLMDEGLSAGNAFMANGVMGELTYVKDLSQWRLYQNKTNKKYIGQSTQIKLYSNDSPFIGDEWRFSLIVPNEDWTHAIKKGNHFIFVLIGVLLVISLFLATFISKKFIHPVVHALEIVKDGKINDAVKTNILEIDDLFEYLAKKDQEIDNLEFPHLESLESAPNLSAYESFAQNINLLSAAERAVFNLYTKGHSAKEISEILCLSMNTIKTHNRRIFQKLNVGSRKELMVYIQMMFGTLEEES